MPNLDLFVPEFHNPGATRLAAYVTARSVANLADAPHALTVGALNSAPKLNELARYSSEGPTNGPGGAATGGLLKPELAAFAGVDITAISSFIGTSAAAPPATCGAALVQSALLAATTDSLQEYLLSRAVDVGIGGPDTAFGYGRLHLGAPPAAPSPPPAGQTRLLVPIVQR